MEQPTLFPIVLVEKRFESGTKTNQLLQVPQRNISAAFLVVSK